MAFDFSQNLKKEIYQKLISLKLDIATRYDRSILGINIQFIDNGEIKLRTLCMKEIKERHTSEYLKKIILDVLNEHEIRIDQIYTITTDNAANMIKLIKLLIHHDEEDDEDDILNDYLDNDNLNNNDDIIVNENEEPFFNIENINLVPHTRSMLMGIRCASHTFQLAINDCIKNSNEIVIINKARNICKKIRNQTTMSILSKLNLKKPLIDCCTRWNSIYLMLERLLELKNFCQEISAQSNDREKCLSENEWKIISDILKALYPSYILTKYIQSEQMTMGDFYAAWIKCIMQTSKIDTSFAKLLVCTIKAREINLKNEVFCSAIYLDPRYNVFLSFEEKDIAKKHLYKTWNLIQNLNNQNIENLDTIPTCSHSKDNLDDDFEDLLMSHESLNKNSSQGIENYNKCVEIEYIIRSFDNIERLEKDANLLNYWGNVKNSMPELYKLAMVVLAVPATQVSVERAFSSLKFILSAQRTKLNPEILENILVIRSNSLFKNK
ncbi:zinc finger BED domain-containing protein 4-like [Gordionus sp. m RMFG-2023]|uniref:zinc finger BED domain-containing protein 4-like n=1 Tax=Gordionus sp. m RMFG-2023 TaxID=3053472 RepID=UPI0031FC14A8